MFSASIRFLVDDFDRGAAAAPGIDLIDDEVSTVKGQHAPLFGCVALEIHHRADCYQSVAHRCSTFSLHRRTALPCTSIHATSENPPLPWPLPGIKSTNPTSSTRLTSGFSTHPAALAPAPNVVTNAFVSSRRQ